MNDTTEQTASVEPPFEKGFPVADDACQHLDLLESVLTQRAIARGITDVALSDAQISVDAAMSRTTLLPVLVDYANHMIFQQSELSFDSKMMDDLMVATLNDEQTPKAETGEQALEQASDIERHVKTEVQSPLFYNREDANAPLGFRVDTAKIATIPVSVSLLLMDTALESAHQMSVQEQTASDGANQSHILDLTYVTDYLSRLDIQDRVIAPAALHAKLEALAKGHVLPETVFEPKPTNDLPDDYQGSPQ